MYRREQQDILLAIVTAAGEEIATDFDAAYRSKDPRNHAVAHFIDALLCELQNSGALEADDFTGSDSWQEAVIDAFDIEDDTDDEEED